MKRVSIVVLVMFAIFAAAWTHESSAQTSTTPSVVGTPDATTCLSQASTISALQLQVSQLKKDLASARKGQSSGNGAAKSNSKATKTPKIKTYKIGDTFKAGDFTLTATSVVLEPTFTPQYGGTHTARGVYLVVYFTAVNDTNNPTAIPFDAIVAKTKSGRTYTFNSDATIALTIDIGTGIYDPLQPGLSVDTAVVYDVPADETGFSLTTTNGSFTIDLGQ